LLNFQGGGIDMKWLFVLPFLIFFSGHRVPQFYYWNGKQLEVLRKIQVPNLGWTSLRFFVKSPYELETGGIDSVNGRICLPDSLDRANFHLGGRWYVISWQTTLNVGISQHAIVVRSVEGTIFIHKFVVAVEGAMKMEQLHINH